MRQLSTSKTFEDIWHSLGQKINSHLIGLDDAKNEDKQKILELCQVGKLISSYFDDFEIMKVSEKPDFVISNGQLTVGLEHQLILDPETKSKEGFYSNIFDKVERKLIQDDAIPNFLLNVIIKGDADLTVNNKDLIINQLVDILRDFLFTGELKENDYIVSARSMKHSRKSISANYGAYIQRFIDKNIILEFLKKKDDKIDTYISNSCPIQWLVLVIGGLGESSYEIDSNSDLEIDTKFDKVFLYEDFRNRLYELK
ncbi:MAG: hypothetical protein QY309_03020 [Cyclobacteriaceae bacterium]|nr:MAG: hypothetical protein QY309_03020 [Cyclobacteriaceae bacterium]